MTPPLVSIVSICWNRKSEIIESLEHIFALDYDNFEVIVVDNNSSDGTSEAVEELFAQVRLMRTSANIGIGAYNIGFASAKGEYILILDDDSFPAKESVTRMVEKFSDDPNLGVVAFDVRNYFSYDGIVKAEADKETSLKHLQMTSPKHLQMTSPKHLQMTSSKHLQPDYLMGFNGAGAGIRRKLFERIGYYPEEFFLYLNEQDTSFRVWNSGYKITLFTDCIAYHKFSPKNRTSTRMPFYYTRNMFWLVWKHYPLPECVRLTVLFIYWCIYYSLEQRTCIYLQAMLNAFININKAIAKRNPVSENIRKNMRVSFIDSFTGYR